MKIAVINGSPKGENSITLQTVLYLERLYPEHQFRYIHAGARINGYTKDFSEAKSILSDSEMLLFAYPVYTFLAPSQLHAFIRLMKESGTDFTGKYASVITTSKHFYDVTAHRYIEENALDMGMRCIRGLSADMEDLLSKKGREEAQMFFERLIWSVKEGAYWESKPNDEKFIPDPATCKGEAGEKSSCADVVLITDVTDKETNLWRMIQRFTEKCKYKVRIVNIGEYPFKGGCLGCFRCAVSEKCVYKDGFDSFLRSSIQTADAVVYAFGISDHSMGVRFKMYDDRNFCNGHRTVTSGVPAGYIVSGKFSAEENLRTVIEARCETGGNFLCGIATDELSADKETDILAKSIAFAIETKHRAPQNFYGVGGMKIFRDLIYLMRGMMRADHKFYKKRGIYDFPQKKKLYSAKMYLVGMLLSNRKLMAKMGNRMNSEMLKPYKKVIDRSVRK